MDNLKENADNIYMKDNIMDMMLNPKRYFKKLI